MSREQDFLQALIKSNTKLDAIEALRPPCRTCHGTQKGAEGVDVDGHKSWAHCPDCVDGKVSIEQAFVTYNAVHGSDAMQVVIGPHRMGTPEHHGASVMLDHLRSVKP